MPTKHQEASSQGRDLLEEVYKATTMGVTATDILLPKVEDQALRSQIERQRNNYQGMASKARELLENEGEDAGKGSRPMQKAMLWGSIQMNTLMNNSTEHMAEMMIQGSTMGIVDMQKRLNDLPASDEKPRRLAEEFIEGEQHSIENLKQLL